MLELLKELPAILGQIAAIFAAAGTFVTVLLSLKNNRRLRETRKKLEEKIEVNTALTEEVKASVNGGISELTRVVTKNIGPGFTEVVTAKKAEPGDVAIKQERIGSER